MRWKVTLVAEVESGQSIKYDITSIDRDQRITPATLGLSIAEGKAVLAAIQRSWSWITGNVTGRPPDTLCDDDQATADEVESRDGSAVSY